MRARVREGAFTTTELMVVVVIIGVLAAMSAPRMIGSRKAAVGRDFTSTMARELQRARMAAVNDRLPMRAYVFPDRLEIRTWTQPDPLLPPTAPVFPGPPADPPIRVVRAAADVTAYNVDVGAVGSGSVVPLPATPVEFEFAITGGLTGNQARFLYVRNANVKSNHPEYEFRIDITALTGHVQMRAD